MSDMVFRAAFKVYSTVSVRRFMSDQDEAFNKGYLPRLPRHSALFKYLEMPALTSAINGLIVASSLPLKAVETDFAVDSSGFGLPGRVGWRETKYGSAFGGRQDWMKVHLMTGVKTNIIKVLCHNICVVIQSVHELGIEPTLWTESAVVHKVT